MVLTHAGAVLERRFLWFSRSPFKNGSYTPIPLRFFHSFSALGGVVAGVSPAPLRTRRRPAATTTSGYHIPPHLTGHERKNIALATLNPGMHNDAKITSYDVETASRDAGKGS